MLEKLDIFLKRIEPEIESITGEERDTASFMKMMRLFNEVFEYNMPSLNKTNTSGIKEILYVKQIILLFQTSKFILEIELPVCY